LSGVFLGNRYHKDVNGLSNAVLYKKQFYLIKVTSEPTIKDSVLSFNADFYLSDSTGANRSIHFISSRSTVLGGSNLAIEIGQFALVYARLENPPKPTLPGEFDYEAYLRRKLSDSDISGIDLQRWINESEGMSLSHLKELVISVIVMGKSFEEAISSLSEMKKSPKIKRSTKLGFGS
jgi:hypothetical protein